jgi:hypothetical protein
LCFSVVSLLSLSRQTVAAVIILYIETIATLAKLNTTDINRLDEMRPHCEHKRREWRENALIP